MDSEVSSLNDKEFSSSKTSLNRLSQRSELAQEIVSRTPDFMEKWGLFIFLLLLLLMFAASWFVKYPDIIEAQAILTAKDAPKEIIAQLNGRLTRLFVHNNEKVNKLQVLGWIESTAKHVEVLQLSKQIDSCIYLLNQGKIKEMPVPSTDKYNNLGNLQQPYQEFMIEWQQFNDYMINGFYLKRKELLQRDISTIDQAEKLIETQIDLTKKDLVLAKESYDMHKKLFEDKVLTTEELRSQDSRYLNKQMAIPQLQSTLLANEKIRRDKLKEIEQLDHDLQQQKIIFSQILQSLKSKVDEWKKNYILLSPVDGKVFFSVPLQENQYLQGGKLLGFVNPDDNHYYAEAILPQTNLGKIDTGLMVQLRFDAYPYQELGYVAGKIEYVSGVSSDSGFLATIHLVDGLKTDVHKTLPYKNGLKARAIIITKTVRLTDRLLFNIVKSTSVGD